jgi:hypothetical protein
VKSAFARQRPIVIRLANFRRPRYSNLPASALAAS